MAINAQESNDAAEEIDAEQVRRVYDDEDENTLSPDEGMLNLMIILTC